MDKENNKGIRRGEIFWYDFGEQDGSVQKGYRPVIVLQDNIINSYSDTVIVAPLTGVIKKPYWFSHLLIGKKFGLSLPSMILMEQITTVNQTGLGDYIGIVNEKSVNKAIRISLMKTLGIWENVEGRTGDVRCLCKHHLDEYKMMPELIIKRFDPLQVKMEKCDKCTHLGYDYLFFEKKDVLKKRGDTNGK